MIKAIKKLLAPESRSAIQDVLDYRLQMASGELTVEPGTLALAEIAAGLWERGMAAASSDRLSSRKLGIMGRDLLVHGNSVWYKLGSVLVPVSDWDIQSTTVLPSSWTYRLTIQSPSGSATIDASYDSVVHVRIRPTRNQPWRGRSPWSACQTTATLATRLEASLSHEESGPIGNILPVPSLAGATNIAGQLPALKGKTVLGETMQSGWEVGSTRAPGGTDWKPVRIGPEPPNAQLTLRAQIQSSLLAAAGIPVELVAPGTGADAREGWRRFLFSTLAPVGKLIGAEVMRVLGGNGILDWSDLAASDLQARARAYKGLLDAGMDEARASRICGF